MAILPGDQYSTTDSLKKADGRGNDAGVRRFENSIDLATAVFGAADQLKITIPSGAVFDGVELGSTVNLSALTFQVGVLGTPAKYAAATAGPAANATTPKFGKPEMRRSSQATTSQETVLLTPSSALPGAGILTFFFYAAKR
jgi:hypothetical protein